MQKDASQSPLERTYFGPFKAVVPKVGATALQWALARFREAVRRKRAVRRQGTTENNEKNIDEGRIVTFYR